MFTVLLYNGLCTSNMFMVLQVVVLWSYELYILCCYIYLSTKMYFIGGWSGLSNTMHLHSVTLSRMLRLG